MFAADMSRSARPPAASASKFIHTELSPALSVLPMIPGSTMTIGCGAIVRFR